MIRRKQERYLMPAVASLFIAGSGQVLKGEGKKGLKIMLWFFFGLPLLAMLSMIINAYLFMIILAVIIVVYPVIWLYNIYDAFTYQIR